MEKNTTIKEKKPRKPGTGGARANAGGARAGAGRPKGSTEQISVSGLLAALKKNAKGKDYQEILVEDFLKARDKDDTHAMIKYHTLILNKVMNTLTKVEVTDSEDQVAAKQQAFADALAKLTGIKKDK
jgi:hypothetical protein